MFVSYFEYTRYAAARQIGNRLLFLSAFAGVLLLMPSRVAVIFIVDYFPEVGVFWKIYAPLPYTGTALGAFMLGCIIWIPFNILTSREKALAWAVDRYANLSEKILSKAMDELKQVQITMDDGKVYVGFELS